MARFRLVPAGAVLGLLIAFKPNLIFVAMLPAGDWLVRRQWRECLQEAGGVALGISVAVGCSMGATGDPRVWLDWLAALRGVPFGLIGTSVGNYSPRALLSSSLGGFTEPVLVAGAVGAIGVGLWLRASKGQPSQPMADSPFVPRAVWLVSLGCLALVLVPQLAWLHYYVLTVPALLLVLSNLANREPGIRGASRLCLVAIAWLGLALGPWSAFGIAATSSGYGAMVASATVALLVATIASHVTPRQAEG
jgi:hypothetical protein